MTKAPMRQIRGLTLFLLVSGCGGSNLGEAVRPKDATYSSAVGESKPAICHEVAADGSPLIVDWKPEDRGDLEVAMKQGVAIVHYDCDSVKLLPTCRVQGAYPYLGISRKEQVISLANADEAKANLPFNGGQLGASLSRGSTLDIGLVMVGKSSTAVDELQKSTLSGACDGATHFVRSVTLGAFAMKTGTAGSVKAAAQVFAMGASGGSSSTRKVDESDGSIDACKQANPDAPSPPSDCRALLRIQLHALGAKAPDKTKGAPDLTCPQGLTIVDGKCVSNAVECKDDDQPGCDQQCTAGSVASCLKLADTYAEKADNDPKFFALWLGSYKRGCDLGDLHACEQYGDNMILTTPKEDLASANKAVEVLTTTCLAGHMRACSDLGGIYKNGYHVPKDTTKAASYLRRACYLGEDDDCDVYGDLVVESDRAEATKAWQMACSSAVTAACDKLAGARKP